MRYKRSKNAGEFCDNNAPRYGVKSEDLLVALQESDAAHVTQRVKTLASLLNKEYDEMKPLQSAWKNFNRRISRKGETTQPVQQYDGLGELKPILVRLEKLTQKEHAIDHQIELLEADRKTVQAELNQLKVVSSMLAELKRVASTIKNGS